jgi:hypothetical protein
MLWKFKKIYQESSIDVLDPLPNIFSALISNKSATEPDDLCNLLTLDDVVYIQQQNVGFITPGDIVYFDSIATSPFNGGDEYFKIKASNTSTYIVQINNLGVILDSPGFGLCL